MAASRSRLVALVVLLSLAGLLTVIALVTGGGSDDPGLRVEISPSQVSVFVRPEDNTPGRAKGEPTVTLECRDSRGKVVHTSQQGWPFGDTDGGIYDPHSHVGVAQGVEARVASCSLGGTGLSGRPSTIR